MMAPSYPSALLFLVVLLLATAAVHSTHGGKKFRRYQQPASPLSRRPLLVSVRAGKQLPGFQCVRAGYFNHESDCTRFYHCVDYWGHGKRFTRFEYKCAAGTMFDQSISVCNHPAWIQPKPKCLGSTGPSTLLPGSGGSGYPPSGTGSTGATTPSPVTPSTGPSSGTEMTPAPTTTPGGVEESSPPVIEIQPPFIDSSGPVTTTPASSTGEEEIKPPEIGAGAPPTIPYPGSGSTDGSYGSTTQPPDSGTSGQQGGEGSGTNTQNPGSGTGQGGEQGSGSGQEGGQGSGSGSGQGGGQQPDSGAQEGGQQPGSGSGPLPGTGSEQQPGSGQPGSGEGEQTGGQGGQQPGSGSEQQPGSGQPGSGEGEQTGGQGGQQSGPGNEQESGSGTGQPGSGEGEQTGGQGGQQSGPGNGQESEGTGQPGSGEGGQQPGSGSGQEGGQQPGSGLGSEQGQGGGQQPPESSGSGQEGGSGTGSGTDQGQSTPPSVPPSSSSTTSPFQSFQIICNDQNFYRHPVECNLYYQCLWTGGSFNINIQTCPTGLVFDDPSSTCRNPVESAPCNGSSLTTIQPPSGEIQSSTTAPITIPPASSSTEESTSSSSTTITIPDVSSSTEATTVSSPTSITQAPTQGSSTKPQYTLAQGSMYNCKVPGHFPYQLDCIRFYRCFEVTPGVLKGLLYRCPAGYGYSIEKEWCVRIETILPCDRSSVKVGDWPIPVIPLEETTPVLLEDFDSFFSNPNYFYQPRYVVSRMMYKRK